MINNNNLTPEEKKLYFNSFIEEYKDNTLMYKQQTIISELKELIAIFENLCSISNIEHELLINREILDINKEGYTQDDFAEAVYTYIQMYKEILADYLIPILKENEYGE